MSDVIRVAQVIGKLSSGGVESVTNNYYKYIDKEKFQFDYIIDSDSVLEPPEELKQLGARYFVVPPYQHIFAHIKALKKLFKENGYSIVHCGMNTLNPISLYAAKCAGVPVRINHNHSVPGKGEPVKNTVKYALRVFAKTFATSYAACSYWAGEWLFGRKAMESGRVTVLNNAIDSGKFAYNKEIRDAVRKEFGIENKLVIGNIGRFCFQKNHEFLLDVFCEVHRKNSSSVLMLLGCGELEKEIKAKVNALGLNDCVLFFGVRSDACRFYQAMDVFVFPSRYEGLGMVAIEAQAAGLPCLLSCEVPQEAVITDIAERMNLTDGAEKWAERVLKLAEQKRSDTRSAVAEAGYDIASEAVKLEHFYEAELERLATVCVKASGNP